MDILELIKPVVLIGILIWIIYQTLEFVRGKSSISWKATPAKVVNTRIETREDEDIEESRPYIQYQYAYLGKRYTGSKIKFGNIWSYRYSDSSAFISGLVKNSDITVYVNEKNPKQSVMYKGYSGHILLQLAIAITCLAIVAAQ